MVRVLLVVCAFFCGLLIHNHIGIMSFPLPDCQDMRIDLLLVAHTKENGFREQMKLFSLLVDLFLGPDETELDRLQVALLVYISNPNNDFHYSKIFNYSRFVNKTEAQDFIARTSFNNVQFSSTDSDGKLQNTSVSSIFEARKDAQQVSVFVAELPHANSLFQNGLNSRKDLSRIFLVIVDDPFYQSSITVNAGHYVRVKDFSSLEHTHDIAVGLCDTCFRDWFGFPQRNGNNLLWTYSCYRIVWSENRIAWIDSLKRCEESKSLLASVERAEELDFLRNVLINASDAMRDSYNIQDDNGEFPIQIGLTRDRESLSKRFRWVNNAPLTVTHWGDFDAPDGGYVQSCGAWILRRYETTENWDDFGCGYTNAHFYLCEANIKTVNPGYVSYSSVGNVRPDQPGLLRGELAQCPGSATLLSASEMLGKKGNEDCVLFSPRGLTPLQHWSQLVVLFNCEDQMSTSIAYSFVCDHKTHCPNGRDEAVCLYRQCDPLAEFTCSSKQCVPAEARCDLYRDCYDGSDEVDCTDCKFKRCQDGSCLPTHWWYDDEVDCIGVGSLEDNIWDVDYSHDNKSEYCAFMCNRTKCVSQTMLGDGVIDCTGPEGPLDETIGSLEKSSCGVYRGLNSTTWSPKCVYYRDRYDSPLGCRNMNHLQGCRHFPCPEGYLKCPGSYCIPMHQAHDGKNDCPLGEDELSEFFSECPGNFLCMKSRVCVYIDLVCDGFPHCPEGDDELNCHVTCGPGFLCVGGSLTVSDYNKSTPLLNLDVIDPRVRYIDLSGVTLSTSFPYIFLERYINNLNVLLLSKCCITSLDYEIHSLDSIISFNKGYHGEHKFDLSGVYWADFSHNHIDRVQELNVLRVMLNLQVLNLSHNKLTNLVAETFEQNGQSSLRVLDLSYTSISSTIKLFDPLVNLVFLNLSHTPLSDLRFGTFSSHGKLQLQVLDLRSIPLSSFYPDTFKGVSVSSGFYTDTYRLCCPQVRGPGIASDVCHAPDDPLSTCSDLMGDELKRVLLWLAGLLAVFGNLGVIVYRIRWTRPLLKKAYGMFVVHLAVSDILMGVYLLIIASADVFYRNVYIWHETRWRNHALCQIAGFLSLISCEVSICFITLITLDRFLVIKYPLSSGGLSRRVTIAICLQVWLVCSVVALVPLFPKFTDWTTYSSNGMCLGLPLTSQRLPGWEFSSAIFIGFNCFMFLLIVLGQVTIYRIIAAASRKQRDLCAVNSTRQQQDFAAARQLFLVAMTNFLCWFPIGVMGLVSVSGHEIGLAAFAWSAVVIMPINSALNPVLYTVPALLDRLNKITRRNFPSARKAATQYLCSMCQSSYVEVSSAEDRNKT